MAAILTTSGRVAIAIAIQQRTAHLAWGSGDPSWGLTPPAPPGNASALLAEVGRRKATTVQFVTPDPAGEIAVPEGRFSVSPTPTNSVCFDFFFQFEDGVGETIREVAVFLDTVADAGVPLGKQYLEPSEVDTPGTLLVIQRIAPIVRELTTRQRFQIVVTF